MLRDRMAVLCDVQAACSACAGHSRAAFGECARVDPNPECVLLQLVSAIDAERDAFVADALAKGAKQIPQESAVGARCNRVWIFEHINVSGALLGAAPTKRKRE